MVHNSTGDTLLSLACLSLPGSCKCQTPATWHFTNIGRILFNVLYCAKVNRDKRNGKYDQFAGYNDDRNPEFKMVL